MLEKRVSSSSVVLNQKTLFVTGGYDVMGGALSYHMSPTLRLSTEIISLDQPPIKGPDLPFTIYSHSMVEVDSKTVFLIGGIQNGHASKETWIIDVTTKNYSIKSGPPLNVARISCSCGKIKLEGKYFLVVAGGHIEGSYHDSIELLDTEAPNQGWMMLGNKL